MNILWYLIQHFWRFWMVLFLWLIVTFLFCYFTLLFVEWLVPQWLYKQYEDKLYLSLFFSSIVLFFFYYILTWILKTKKHKGIVLNLETETEYRWAEDEPSDFVVLLKTDSGNKKIKLNKKTYLLLRIGMTIEMLYDGSLKRAIKIDSFIKKH